MSEIEVSPVFSPFVLEALNNDVVLDEIISYLGSSHHDLIKYRSVCHKWNDLIVRKINKSGPSLHIPLRYGPEVPQKITKSGARRWAQEILENVSIVLTGTASRLLFDTIVITRDFYLAGVVLKWKQFLEAHGNSIRHLNFKIRSNQFPESENHVTDCDEIISMTDLVSTFSETPNLESLYFSIRFSNYPDTLPKSKSKPVLLGNLPILHKLTNITFREPEGISSSDILFGQILGMAPNLTSLCVKPSSVLSTHAAVMDSMNQDLTQSLSSLKISKAHFHEFSVHINMIHFPYLNLTTLELNNISGLGRHGWIDKLLLAQHTSLTKLVLGNRKNSNPLLRVQDIQNQLHTTPICFVQFPPVMEHLKSLEVNLSKFIPFRNGSYEIQFPFLDSFTLSGATENENGNEWRLDHIPSLFPSLESARCHTLTQFYLIGPIHQLNHNQIDIIMSAQRTFPKAEWHFHSEADNRCSREFQRAMSHGLCTHCACQGMEGHNQMYK